MIKNKKLIAFFILSIIVVFYSLGNVSSQSPSYQCSLLSTNINVESYKIGITASTNDGPVFIGNIMWPNGGYFNDPSTGSPAVIPLYNNGQPIVPGTTSGFTLVNQRLDSRFDAELDKACKNKMGSAVASPKYGAAVLACAKICTANNNQNLQCKGTSSLSCKIKNKPNEVKCRDHGVYTGPVGGITYSTYHCTVPIEINLNCNCELMGGGN
jgi:hypothetical protein